MELGRGEGRLKDIAYYLKKSFKFFDMKDEKFTPVIFLIILVSNFVGVFIPMGKNGVSLEYVIFNFVSFLFVFTASTTYLLAYIRELKGQPYSIKEAFTMVLRNFGKILLGSLLYSLSVVLGLVLIIIPGIIVSITFIFYLCFILDGTKGINNAFIASRFITNGKRKTIFSILIIFNVILTVPLFFIMIIAMASNNTLVFNFVFYFASTIILLMQQRLTALMYKDLVYGVVEQE
jgi:hypothetical protein